MELYIGKTYLWLPVCKEGKKEIVSIFFQKEKIHEFEIGMGNTDDFYAFINVSGYKGKKIVISGGNSFFEQMLRVEDNKPDYRDERRPRLHFTPEVGWMNDPNGLIYKDGWWHMFFQHNPYGIEWGNMHWGHAKSRDLMNWEQLEEAVYPDEYGVVFSGCAVEDKGGVAGLGKGSILFYYTAATNAPVWSSENVYMQRLICSVDGGDTLMKTEEGGVPWIEGSNRDPKVLYYEPTKRFIMVLYLDKNDYMILESENLLSWKSLQRITLENAWECPDLLEVPVENETGMTKWIFWSADGFYFLGDFDGKQFITDGKRRKAYGNRLPYAAQSYWGTGNRCISQSWLRTPYRGGSYTGMMALPVELSLEKEKGDYFTCLRPVKEMAGFRKGRKYMQVNRKCKYLFSEQSGPKEVIVSMPWQETGEVELILYGRVIHVDFNVRELVFEENRACIPEKDSFCLQVFVDFGVVEIFSQEGRVYFPCVWDVEKLEGEITICNGTSGLAEVIVYGL